VDRQHPNSYLLRPKRGSSPFYGKQFFFRGAYAGLHLDGYLFVYFIYTLSAQAAFWISLISLAGLLKLCCGDTSFQPVPLWMFVQLLILSDHTTFWRRLPRVPHRTHQINACSSLNNRYCSWGETQILYTTACAHCCSATAREGKNLTSF